VRVRTYCFPGFLRGLPGPSTRNHPHDPTTSKPVVPGGYVYSYFSVVEGLRLGFLGHVIPVPRWNPPRRSLGASALVALVAAGCGTVSSQHKPSLHVTAEKRLLSLVARARADATKQDGTAVHAVLGEFVAEVRTLKTSGQLTATTAGQLDGEASTTAEQAAQQLHPRKVATTEPNAAIQTATRPTAATPPPTPTTGANAKAPTTSANGPPAQPSTPATGPQQGDQGNYGGTSRSPGHGHGYGHRLGESGSSWWTALRNWIDANSGGGGGGD
jgi:hypothetical protein